MKTAVSALCTMLLFTHVGGLRAHGWSSLYSIDIAKMYKLRMSNKNTIIVDRMLRMPASQILFSWNALRPSSGYYVFYAQVRSSNTQRWSDWYKMAQWGNGGQRTFEQLMTKDPSFCYVRLEAAEGDFMSECRVKIEAHGQASLVDIAHITIAAVDYHKFTPEYGTGRSFSFPTVRLNKVPAFSQMQVNHVDYDRICSPTSLSMVVSYLMKRNIDPAQFARGVYDDGLKSYGSWPLNIANAFALTDGRYYFMVTRLNAFAHLYDFLRHGLPVVVSVRGHMRTMPQGRTYADGHLLVVIGWDNTHKQVLVLDPAFETKVEVPHAYDINDFLAAWERSYRLAYVVEPA